MYLKFMLGVPFNRQEKEWFRMGMVLTRVDMAYWTIRCSEEWFFPIYQNIREHLLRSEVFHMDESRIQCNKEDGRRASTDSFMWVMHSAACEEVQVAYFYYSLS